MKRLMVVLAVGVVLGFGPTLAAAEDCPVLIKELKERLAKMPDYNYKKERALRLLTEAQKLHDEGKLADCVKKCEETASSLR